MTFVQLEARGRLTLSILVTLVESTPCLELPRGEVSSINALWTTHLWQFTLLSSFTMLNKTGFALVFAGPRAKLLSLVVGALVTIH